MSLKTLALVVLLLVTGVLFSLRGYLCAQTQAHAAGSGLVEPLVPAACADAECGLECGSQPAGCGLLDSIGELPDQNRSPRRLALRRRDGTIVLPAPGAWTQVPAPTCGS